MSQEIPEHILLAAKKLCSKVGYLMESKMTTKIKHLHPQLKKCKCGFVGNRRRLYQHFEVFMQFHRNDAKVFYSIHGEVPLNEGDIK